MSQTLSLTPPPEQLGSLRAGDIDSRYWDFTPDLGPLADRITGAVVTIARRDKQTLTSSDLSVALSPPLSIDGTGLVVTWWLQHGIAGVPYVVTITVTTQQIRTIVRDAFINVVGSLG